jgi:hypothetical protein
VDILDDPSNSIGCKAITSQIESLPRRPQSQGFLRQPAPTGLDASDLIPWKDAMNLFLKDDYQFTLGVEKNPWYMAYVGIRATSAPRQIFFPFGPNLEIRARAYAKPFGGRMGPWHGSAWPKGSLESTGPQTDPFVPERTKAGGLLDSPDSPNRLPNYSRFPGDNFGLTSKLAQNSMKAERQTEDGIAGLAIKFAYYQDLKVEFADGQPNDKLAWDYQNNRFPSIRNYELSAIAPDLFDVTYYSIEPHYGVNYYPYLVQHATALGIGSLVLRSDLGHHDNDNKAYSVQDQMDQVIKAGIRRPESFYYVRDKANVLTGWSSGPEYGNYAFPDEAFGRCLHPDDEVSIKVPGSCISGGGRTGYSVKLISREYLNSALHPMGGPAEPPGNIENPPSNFGEGW